MDLHRKARLKDLIMSQVGVPTLVLNDLLMGDDGAQIFYELVPIHHQGLKQLEIKGNNISPFGFEIICNALLDCRGLRSILAEWNAIGLNSNVGLNALLKLVRNNPSIQKIDLKNNKIDHLTVQPICEIIRMNPRGLKILDLKWNDLGELGGRAILNAIQSNTFLKSLEILNNRISEPTMIAIEEHMVVGGRQISEVGRTGLMPMPTRDIEAFAATTFPISQDEYPGMAVQLRLSEIRSKIETEQKEMILYREKMEAQINKVIQQIKGRGAAIQETQLRLQGVIAEQVNLKNQIKDAQMSLTLFRQSTMKVGYEITEEHADYRRGKYSLNRESQQLMKKLMDKHDFELADFNDQMSKKQQYLAGLLGDRFQRKRDSRDKLMSLEEDCLRFKMERENLEFKVITKTSESEKRRYEETFKQATERVKDQEAQVNALRRKNEYLNGQLTQTVIRGLQRVRKLQSDIFDLQHKVKKLHDEMTKINLEMDGKNTKLQMLIAQQEELNRGIDLRRRQTNNLISEGNVLLDLARQNQIQDRKTATQSSEMVHTRLLQIEKAIRTQQSNNKMIRNQYDKLCSLLQTQAQNAIYYSVMGSSGLATG